MPKAGTYTWEEILGQPAAWEIALEDVLSRRVELKARLTKDFSEAIFTGCGSSYYLSLAAAPFFQAVLGVRARAIPASEVFLFPEEVLPAEGPALLVTVSRSGETTEVVRAAEAFSSRVEGDVLVISCYEDSTLARSYSQPLVARAAKERSIVETSSFTSMLLMTHLATAIAGERPDYLAQLRKIPALGKELIETQKDLARQVGEDAEIERFFFLGSGPNYGLACEGMLKMKETSLSYSEAFHFMEFRHGPKSMIDDSSLVVGLLSDSARENELAVLEEMQSLRARILELGPEGPLADLTRGLSEMTRGVLYMPVLQLVAYYRALAKGLDPDSPTHLEAVVLL